MSNDDYTIITTKAGLLRGLAALAYKEGFHAHRQNPSMTLAHLYRYSVIKECVDLYIQNTMSTDEVFDSLFNDDDLDGLDDIDIDEGAAYTDDP